MSPVPQTNKSVRPMTRLARLALPAAFVVTFAPILTSQTYSPANLDPLHILGAGYAYAIAGDTIVGGGAGEAVVFGPTGPILLPNVPGGGAEALDVNTSGTIVGRSMAFTSAGIEYTPRLWSNGIVVDLNSAVTTPTPLQLIIAEGINEGGSIVGTALLNGVGRAYRFDAGVVTDLGSSTPLSLPASSATKINDAGTAVGWAGASWAVAHACRWDGTTFVDLHDPAQILGAQSGALDVDRFGRACGYAQFTVGAPIHAARFDGVAVADLGVLAPGGSSFATAMNDLGVCVGYASHPSSPNTPLAVRFQNGVVENLNDLIPASSGWKLIWTGDIDNDGRIVGQGTLAGSGALRPFLLTPNCSGGFTVTGAGCSGTGGVTPSLSGIGCAEDGAAIGLEWSGGQPLAAGVLLLGSAAGSLPVTPSCSLSVGALFPAVLPIGLDANGGGLLPAVLPAGLSNVSFTFQTLFADPGASFGVSGSNALRLTLP